MTLSVSIDGKQVVSANLNKKWTTLLVTIGGTLASSYFPQIKDWISNHPQFMPYVTGALMALAHLLPSPWQQQGTPPPVESPKP